MFSPSFILYTLGSGGPEQEGIMLGLQAQNPISFQQSSFYVVLLLLCPDQANRGEECRRPMPCRKQGTKGRCPCFWASGTGFLVSFHIHLDWKIRASVGRIIPLHLFLSGGNNTSENVFLLAPTFPLVQTWCWKGNGGPSHSIWSHVPVTPNTADCALSCKHEATWWVGTCLGLGKESNHPGIPACLLQMPSSVIITSVPCEVTMCQALFEVLLGHKHKY